MQSNIDFTQLIAGLSQPAAYDHAVDEIHTAETHISVVILTGPFAYKIKKPVDLGFLDFTTLERRKFFCDEELRLNKRLADDLYADVVKITGDSAAPRINGAGRILDYAVKMRQFDPAAQLDVVIDDDGLNRAHIERFAVEIADFHAMAAVASVQDDYASQEVLVGRVLENFERSRPCANDDRISATLQSIETWSNRSLQRNSARFAQRKRNGFVRECHGDLHLANLLLMDDRIRAFDCLEFNAQLRWIDVMSEIAFTIMDLDYRGRPDLGAVFLNRYLERSGDYQGIDLLRHYLCYRAMVRAKVACLRGGQNAESSAEFRAAQREFRAHTDLAAGYAVEHTGVCIVITHGVSGCGKTYLTERLLGGPRLIRIRSDIERKRMAGVDAAARTGSKLNSDLYSGDEISRTYSRLAELSEILVRAGYRVIVDATFLERSHRSMFRQLARRLGAEFVILDVAASQSVLENRIRQRLDAGNDASEATLEVLHQQVAVREALDSSEQSAAITVNTELPIDVIDTLKALFGVSEYER